MPIPWKMLKKCAEKAGVSSVCRAPAIKNSNFCRWHLKNHPEELEKIAAQNLRYKCLDDANIARFSQTNDPLERLEAHVAILRNMMAGLIRSGSTTKCLTIYAKLSDQFRKSSLAITKSEEYWERKGKSIVEDFVEKAQQVISDYIPDMEKRRAFFDEINKIGEKRS